MVEKVSARSAHCQRNSCGAVCEIISGKSNCLKWKCKTMCRMEIWTIEAILLHGWRIFHREYFSGSGVVYKFGYNNILLEDIMWYVNVQGSRSKDDIFYLHFKDMDSSWWCR